MNDCDPAVKRLTLDLIEASCLSSIFFLASTRLPLITRISLEPHRSMVYPTASTDTVESRFFLRMEDSDSRRACCSTRVWLFSFG
jgi:hypothetical protein